MQINSPKHLWCITKWSKLALTWKEAVASSTCLYLNEGWAAAFKRMLLPKDQRRPGDQHDFGAELRLRGLEIPYHLVQDAMNELQRRIRDNPEAARDSLLEDLGRFLDEMDKPKN